MADHRASAFLPIMSISRIRANPYTLPIDIARHIKGRSSHLLREEFPYLNKLPSLWTRSTFYSTEGFVSSEIIAAYIERQKKA